MFARRAGMFPHLPRILSEGDSWFDLPFAGRNIIEQLRAHYDGQACWLRLEHSGDEVCDMFLPKRDRRLNAVDEFRRVLGKYTFHVLMISGGGNDIIGADGAFFATLLRPSTSDDPARHLDLPRLDAKLDEVITAYEVVLRLRDQLQPGKPVVTHVYDYAIPRNRPVRLLLPVAGPWLWPQLQRHGVTEAGLQRGIVRVMIDRFAERLRELAGRPGAHLHVVETRGLVKPSEWPDEIHPSEEGFHRVAGAFVPVLRQLCPGRFAGAWPLAVD
jgi:hypothetical protein